MDILSWIVVGGLAGWIASKFTGRDKSMGIGANILVGIGGAIIGGWIARFLNLSGPTGINLWSIAISVVGAIVLITILKMLKK